jgi:hypothetical protein
MGSRVPLKVMPAGAAALICTPLTLMVSMLMSGTELASC